MKQITLLYLALLLGHSLSNAQSTSLNISSANQAINPTTTFNAWAVVAEGPDMQSSIGFADGTGKANTTGPPGSSPIGAILYPITPGPTAYAYTITAYPGWAAGFSFLSCFNGNTMYNPIPAFTDITNNGFNYNISSCSVTLRRKFGICSATSQSVNFTLNITVDNYLNKVIIDADSANPTVLYGAGEFVGVATVTFTGTTILTPGIHTIDIIGSNAEDQSTAFAEWYPTPSGEIEWNPFGIGITGTVTSTNNVLVNDNSSCCIQTTSTLDTTICSGDSYLGHIATGSFNDTLTNAAGCDSIITVNLTVNNNCTVPCNTWLSTPSYQSYVDVGQINISGTQLTVEATINRTQPYNYGVGDGSDGDIVSKHQSPADINYLLRPTHAYITTSNGFFGTPDICAFNLNQTYHVAMVYNGSTLKFYRDGYLMAQIPATGNLFQNSYPTRIGLYTGAVIENFLGYVNEVRIWNVARTQTQLRAYMNTPLPNPTAQTGLVAYYSFNNLLNKQGNAAYNGTLAGGASINATNPNCTFVTDSCCTPTTSTLDTTICSGQSYLGYTATSSFNDTLINSTGCDSIRTINLTVTNCTPQLCTGTLGAPIVNITFGSGASNPGPQLTAAVPGASTSYNFASYATGVPSNPPLDGDYALVNEVPFNSAWFTGAKDHTGNPNGYMAFFNAAPTPGEFYRQTVNTLCPGTTYEFAAWIANVLNPAIIPSAVLPNITFKILDPNTQTVLANFTTGNIAMSNTMIWKQYGSVFTLPTGLSSVTLVLSNNNIGGGAQPGNDLAIDDITFRPCGPTTIAGLSKPTICSDSSVTLIGSVSGGLHNPAYQWQLSSDGGTTFTNIPGATTLNYIESGLAIGSYQFQLLSAEVGNIASPTCRFISNAVPLSVINCCIPTTSSLDTTICHGQNYLGHTITGVYHDTLTNATGCDSIITINLAIDSPIVNAGNDSLVCKNSSFNLSGSGINIVQYAWTPKTILNDSTLQSPAVNNIGSTTKFFLTVTDLKNCTLTDSVTITVQLPVVKTNNDTTVCAGNTIPFNTTGANGYSWAPATGLTANNTANPTDTSTVPGLTQYVVTGTSAIGCTANDTVNITIHPNPIVHTNNDTSICIAGSVQLNTIGADTYIWSPVTGLTNAGIANPVATPVNPTQYIVTGTITSTGCAAKDTVNISIYPNPTITKTRDTVICKNTSAQLYATGGITYQWSPGATLTDPTLSNPVATPAANTTYYVLVTDANTCANNDSVKVSMHPDPVFSISPDTLVCSFAGIHLRAGGGDVYAWTPANLVDNPALSDPITTANITTTYHVSITDSYCNISVNLSTTLTLAPPLILSLLKSNDIDCSVGSAQLTVSGADTYSWSPAIGLSDTTIANPVASPFVTQQYVVRGNDLSTGCAGYDSIIVYTNFANNDNGYLMPNAFTPNNDGHNDCYGIKYWGVIEQLDFSIYNRWGTRIFHTNNPNDCWDGTFQGNPQLQDTYVYYITAVTGCGYVVRKGNLTLIR